MIDRADAALPAFEFASSISAAFQSEVGQGPDTSAVWTIGKFDISPGAACIVPGSAELVVQFRDPSEVTLDRMEAVRECVLMLCD